MYFTGKVTKYNKGGMVPKFLVPASSINTNTTHVSDGSQYNVRGDWSTGNLTDEEWANRVYTQHRESINNYMKNAWAEYQAAHPGATPDQFIQEWNANKERAWKYSTTSGDWRNTVGTRNGEETAFFNNEIKGYNEPFNPVGGNAAVIAILGANTNHRYAGLGANHDEEFTDIFNGKNIFGENFDSTGYYYNGAGQLLRRNPQAITGYTPLSALSNSDASPVANNSVTETTSVVPGLPIDYTTKEGSNGFNPHYDWRGIALNIAGAIGDTFTAANAANRLNQVSTPKYTLPKLQIKTYAPISSITSPGNMMNETYISAMKDSADPNFTNVADAVINASLKELNAQSQMLNNLAILNLENISKVNTANDAASAQEYNANSQYAALKQALIALTLNAADQAINQSWQSAGSAILKDLQTLEAANFANLKYLQLNNAYNNYVNAIRDIDTQELEFNESGIETLDSYKQFVAALNDPTTGLSAIVGSDSPQAQLIIELMGEDFLLKAPSLRTPEEYKKLLGSGIFPKAEKLLTDDLKRIQAQFEARRRAVELEYSRANMQAGNPYATREDYSRILRPQFGYYQNTEVTPIYNTNGTVGYKKGGKVNVDNTKFENFMEFTKNFLKKQEMEHKENKDAQELASKKSSLFMELLTKQEMLLLKSIFK